MLALYPTATLIVIVVLAACAAVTDARNGLIPNALTFPALALAPFLAGLLGGAPALFAALLGLVACGVIPLLLYRADACGGGDVKLLAALGAFTGARLGLELSLIAFVVATLYALAMLAVRGGLRATLLRALLLLVGPLMPKRWRFATPPHAALASVRLGPAVLVATLFIASRAWP
jgi:prepilin peptidase CpaA